MRAPPAPVTPRLRARMSLSSNVAVVYEPDQRTPWAALASNALPHNVEQITTRKVIADE